MGGGGGGNYISSGSGGSLPDRVRRAETEEADSAFEAGVSQFLSEVLGEANSRDSKETRRLLDGIRTQLGEAVGESIDLLLGGSASKHTYVQGLSDVDALVIVSKEIAKDLTPDQLKSRFARALADKFGGENVSVGDLAVTLRARGVEVQLLPSYRYKDQLRIARADGKGWITVDPKGFAEALSSANQKLSGKLIPAIKLAKIIVAGLPEKQRLSGYHLECLGVELSANYDGKHTQKEVLKGLFDLGSIRTKIPLKDVSGQSSAADDYLGAPGSLERRIACDSLARLARRLRNADGARSLAAWREICERSLFKDV